MLSCTMVSLFHSMLSKAMNIRVIVYANTSARDSRKAVFERIVSVPFGVDVPYNSLVDNLKFLFGDLSIVVFEIA